VTLKDRVSVRQWDDRGRSEVVHDLCSPEETIDDDASLQVF